MTFLRWLLFALAFLLVVRMVRHLLGRVGAALPGGTPPAGLGRDGAARVDGDGDDDREPHQVLGVAPDAPPSEVRRAYQRLIRQYHPDRAAQLAPELQQLAERRTKQLNAAYQAMSGGDGPGRRPRGT